MNVLQHYTFYDFIVNKARGKSGPLFNFDVHDDVRLLADATKEKDESHAGKVVERSYYQRNKHIFPASRWEVGSKCMEKTCKILTSHLNSRFSTQRRTMESTQLPESLSLITLDFVVCKYPRLSEFNTCIFATYSRSRSILFCVKRFGME
jgi:hypothetical protein